MSRIHIHEKDGPYVGQGVDFGVNSDISVGEDGLDLGECVLRQSYSFSYLMVHTFYSFPFAKNVTYRNI